ncbi:MAG: nitrous oxide reductase accessory protein NosL [Methylobacteriaceae bacterium]|jgi:copper chaperone NosL|nr:nitrous oxide reductase accessory protein NosL [Methylobacteriaceae bacterium]
MMGRGFSRRMLAAAAGVVLLLAACSEQKSVAPPPAFEMTKDATGYYCGMGLMEHKGPKGQIILESKPQEPLWFTSVRDTVAFTLLPEEPKDIAAIYVSDMGKAGSWDDPGAKNWTDARTAAFVIGGDATGGMGAPEAVPFSDKTAAAAFAEQHGGKIVGFNDIPKDYVLGSVPAMPADGGHGGAMPGMTAEPPAAATHN